MAIEYRIDQKSYDDKAGMVADLNALGAAGWELIKLDYQNEERGGIGSTGPGDPGTPGKQWHLIGVFKRVT